MFEDCPKFEEFREALEKRGVIIRWGWTAKTHRQGPRQKRDDLAIAIFIGTKGHAPRISTAIVINYGKDGFGLYMDPHDVTGEGKTIEQEAEFIASPREEKNAEIQATT